MKKCSPHIVVSLVTLAWLGACSTPPPAPDAAPTAAEPVEASAAQDPQPSTTEGSGAATQEPTEPQGEAGAAAEQAGQETAQQQEPELFEPPKPNPKDFDWIRLNSGEWLKGDITSMTEDNLVFDSDELDELNLDWGDVAEVYSPRTNMLGFTDQREESGTLKIVGDDIVIGTGAGARRYNRSELLTIVPGEMTEASYWSGKLSLGISNQSGNTEQLTINAKAGVKRQTTSSRVSLDYIGNIGEANSVQNINNHRLTGKWDLLVSRKWFVTPVAVDVFSDRFQNIQVQVTPSAGIGYHLVDTSTVAWDISLGAGYRVTYFDSVAAGGEDPQTTATAIPGLHLDWDITGDIEWIVDYTLEIGVPETERTNQHLVTTLSIDLYGDFDLDLTFQWDRIGQPVPDANGNVPQKDDFRTSVGLGWEF